MRQAVIGGIGLGLTLGVPGGVAAQTTAQDTPEPFVMNWETAEWGPPSNRPRFT